MRAFFAIGLAFLCLPGMISCSRSARIPAGIVEQAKMSAILFDISMAEGHAENAYFRDSAKSRDSILKVELDRVLAIHRVSQFDFLKSYRFYKSKPHLYKVMVDSLQARSQRDQQKMYLQPGQRRKKKPGAPSDTTKL
jgi:hypothetical protein